MVFGHFGCVIFFTLNFRFACLALPSTKSNNNLLRNILVFSLPKNNQKPSYQNWMKSSKLAFKNLLLIKFWDEMNYPKLQANFTFILQWQSYLVSKTTFLKDKCHVIKTSTTFWVKNPNQYLLLATYIISQLGLASSWTKTYYWIEVYCIV